MKVKPSPFINDFQSPKHIKRITNQKHQTIDTVKKHTHTLLKFCTKTWCWSVNINNGIDLEIFVYCWSFLSLRFHSILFIFFVCFVFVLFHFVRDEMVLTDFQRQVLYWNDNKYWRKFRVRNFELIYRCCMDQTTNIRCRNILNRNYWIWW